MVTQRMISGRPAGAARLACGLLALTFCACAGDPAPQAITMDGSELNTPNPERLRQLIDSNIGIDKLRVPDADHIPCPVANQTRLPDGTLVPDAYRYETTDAKRYLGKLAKKERKESIEEMHHADKLVDRILFLEGHPNLQHVAPLMIGENLKEVLECDLKGEQTARESYSKSREICRDKGDYVTMQLFEELLKDEEGHIDFLETQIDLLNRIGVENYGQLNAESADDVEGH